MKLNKGNNFNISFLADDDEVELATDEPRDEVLRCCAPFLLGGRDPSMKSNRSYVNVKKTMFRCFVYLIQAVLKQLELLVVMMYVIVERLYYVLNLIVHLMEYFLYLINHQIR